MIAGVFELLAGNPRLVALGISGQRIKESQSVDEKPFDDGIFIVANFEEQSLIPTLNRGPRVVTLWVHSCDDRSRDYRPIDRILFAIDQIFADVEHYTGSDGVRITGFRRQGRSGNLRDPGWKTHQRRVYRDLGKMALHRGTPFDHDAARKLARTEYRGHPQDVSKAR